MSGGTLPFTESLFTTPLAVVGLVLTACGWIGRKVSPRKHSNAGR